MTPGLEDRDLQNVIASKRPKHCVALRPWQASKKANFDNGRNLSAALIHDSQRMNSVLHIGRDRGL